MRKLILQMQCSLDGMVRGTNGELDWVFQNLDDEYAKWAAKKLGEAGAHLMGSVTYHDMAAHWPSSTEPYAAPMNDIPKVVFSKSLKKAEWPETAIASGDFAQEILKLKRDPGPDLLAHGGVRFAHALIRSGLVDMYRLIIHPVALGSGSPLFPALPAPLRLKSVSEKRFSSGVVERELEPA